MSGKELVSKCFTRELRSCDDLLSSDKKNLFVYLNSPVQICIFTHLYSGTYIHLKVLFLQVYVQTACLELV